MSHALRYRTGPVELHRLRVDAATVINPGDLVYLDTDDVKPAADFPFDTDLATTRENFVAVFLGIAHTASAEGETADVSVDLSPSSIYEFVTTSGTCEVGSLFAPMGDSNGLESQRLAKVTDATVAIARAAQYQSAAATAVRVQFASAFHPASANVNAALG